MARPKVKDLAVAARPAAPAAENLTAFKPGDEHLLVRCRHAEGFTVHLFLREFEIAVEATGDGMPGIADPETLALVGLAPRQRAGRAHQALEDLRVMPRVQHDQAHAFEDALLHALRDAVLDHAMRHVSPPGQHIGLRQPLLGQAVIRLLQGGGRYLRRGQQFLEPVRDDGVHALGIDRRYGGMFMFVDVFTPHGDAQCIHDYGTHSICTFARRQPVTNPHDRAGLHP